MVTAWYDNVCGIADRLKQHLALESCRNQNKGISILTETHINHDQTHHIRNYLLDSIFFSTGYSHTKDCLSWFIQVLKVSLRLKLVQKGGLCLLRLLPLRTEFSVFILLQGMAPGNCWLGGVSLKDYKIKATANGNVVHCHILVLMWVCGGKY